jgi:type IV pilus assembly protein PilP
MGREGWVKIFFFILVISIALSVGGCDQLPFIGGKKAKEQEATPKSIPVKTTPKVAPSPSKDTQTPTPAKEVERDYVYDPTEKRDPFQPFISVQTPVKPVGEEIPITPLQKYDLSQLRLVAIIIGKGEGRAMVEDAEGKGYIIEKGVYVGSNFGKVKAVLKDRVIIEERYKDYLGKVQSKEVVLELYPPGEEKRP